MRETEAKTGVMEEDDGRNGGSKLKMKAGHFGGNLPTRLDTILSVK